MKHILILLSFLSIMSFGAIAQKKQDQEKKKFDVESFRAAQEKIILQEVDLTPEEASAFFPIYHEMNRKKFEVNREVRRQMKSMLGNNGITDAQYTKMVDDQLNARSKEAEIDKEYYARFKKILSPEKVFKVCLAEMKMNKEMLKNRDNRGNKK